MTHVRVCARLCRLDSALTSISKGKTELVKLDSMGLTSASLERVLAVLAKDNVGSNVMTISLSDNLLNDDSCRQLIGALKLPQFCPSLLAINLQGNTEISAAGYAVLNEVVTVRPEVQV